MIRFLLALLVLPAILFSDQQTCTEEDILNSTHTPLTSLYGMPELNIFGVNVINGDYHYGSVDFNLPGADPFIFHRSYSSSSFRSRGFYQGWTHNHASLAFSYKTTKHTHVVTTGSLTGELPFKVKKIHDTYLHKKDVYNLKINNLIFEKGVTNCGAGDISGRNNVKNINVTLTAKGVTVRNADGTVNEYKRDPKHDKHSLTTPFRATNYLKKTTKSNGLSILYNTDKIKDQEDHTIREAKAITYNDKIANSLSFFHSKKKANFQHLADHKSPFHIDAVSKDGKKARYHFAKHSKHKHSHHMINILMSHAEFSHLPNESYRYTHPDDGPTKLSNVQGDHHRIRIDYYNKYDMMQLHGLNPQEISTNHIARNKVKKIWIAVNNQDDLQLACKFSYYKNKDTKNSFTEVYDRHNHLTRFHYSTKNYFLSCVERFKGTSNYTLASRERFKFGIKGEVLAGDLYYKTIETSDGKIHYGECYKYDLRGNVLVSNTHFLKLRGPTAYPITISGNQLKGGEVRTVKYSYNSLNLKILEDDGRLKTRCAYHTVNGKETNLLKSKFSQENDVIKVREFYEFDGNSGCTLSIVDNGSGTTKDDLKDVSCRKTTRCKNREDEFAGLPLEIDTWGSNGVEEKRISRTTLHYDSHGYADSESHFDANDELAYTIEKVRDIQGNIITQSDPLGQVTHRKYNLYGSLLEEQGPSLSFYLKYTYDWLQRPVSETKVCVDGIELTTTKRYDLEGRVTKIRDAYGLSTTFVYNEQGRPIKITHPPLRTECGWEYPCETKEYDFMGNLIRETNPFGGTTHYTLNDAGQPLKVVYSDGTQEEFSYSIFGEVIKKKQKNGSKIRYTYDAFSRVICERVFDINDQFLKETKKNYSGLLLLSEVDGEGLETSYTYDYAGRIAEVQKGKTLTKFSYNSLGKMSEEKRYFGDREGDYISIRFEYDLLDHVIVKEELNSEGVVYSRTETTYDCLGNITSTTTWGHAGKAVTTKTYDDRGDLSSSTDALGNTTYYCQRYDFFMDGLNLPCLEVVDPKGVRTVTISDQRGLPVTEKVYSPSGELISHTELYYDLNGNRVKKEYHLPKEIITNIWEYDSNSKLLRQINGYATPEQLITTFSYNDAGEISKTIYSDGSSKHKIYDALGRLVQEWSDDKSVHYQYTYNTQDLVTTTLDLNSRKETTRKYSLEGDLLQENFENGLMIKYRYDRLSRIVECIYPDNSSIERFYNPLHLSRILRKVDGQEVYDAKFSKFDLSGKPQEIKFPRNAGKLTLQHDLLERPINISYTHYHESQINYDPCGLLISKVVDGNIQEFAHDDLQQLTLEKTEQYSHTYENDSLYRQTSVDGYAQNHNAVHQLTEGIHGNNNFDDKGRRVEDSVTHYSYDNFDRLILVKNDEDACSYTYDAFNRKMSRSSNGTTVYYLYDNQEEIGTYDKDGIKIDQKILSAGENSIPLAIELGSQCYAPLISSQGHIVGLVEIDTGKLSDKSFLSIFGEDLGENPLSPWRYCGKRHETKFEIIDFGFRFYHPKSAQWLIRDPIGDSDGPNLYAYVKNCPDFYIDRYGLYSDGFSFNESYSYIKNTAYNSTFGNPRFTGALMAFGGLCEVTIGAASITGGICVTGTGVGAPAGMLAVAGGTMLVAHGSDNMIAGFKQFLTGRTQESLTTKCLKSAGCSDATANAVDMCIGLGCGGVGTASKAASLTQTANKFSRTSSGCTSVAKANTQNLSRGAENVNASESLRRKFAEIVNYQQKSVNTKILLDGRIRYSLEEIKSSTIGSTRGACRVLEWNPKTGQTRSWYQCHDHLNNINRIHPKSINGQIVSSQHYPLTKAEL